MKRDSLNVFVKIMLENEVIISFTRKKSKLLNKMKIRFELQEGVRGGLFCI